MKTCPNTITKIDGFKDVTIIHNDYFSDEQINIITEWINGIKGNELSKEWLEVSDNAVLRLNKALGYTSLETIDNITELPNGIDVYPQVWAEIDDDTDEYRGDATIKLIHTGCKDINVLFECNLKMVEVEDNTDLKKMLTLSEKEALDTLEAYKEFMKYYYLDGSPRVKEVGTENVELITNYQNNDAWVEIIKSWIESIKGFEAVTDWGITYTELINDETRRLSDMLGGEIIEDNGDLRILIDGIEIYPELDDDYEEFTLNIKRYNEFQDDDIIISFNGEYVYEELRKIKLKELE